MTNLVNVEGTWGAPFWGATMLFLGIYSTMMLNVSRLLARAAAECRAGPADRDLCQFDLAGDACSWA